MSGTVITVASGKGGVGKTTTAVNLAVALWQEGNAVALVDADLGMANLAAVLALTPEATLHDVLAGEATLEEATIEAKDGDLLVLPGERELVGFANADPAELRVVLDDLGRRSDYVIVDTGAGLSYEDVLPLGLADQVLLVSTPDPAAAGDTRKTLELAGLLDAPIRGVVVTRTTDDTDVGEIAAEVGADLLGTIPEDPAVTESTTSGNPLESHAPDSPATAAYRDLAAALVAREAPAADVEEAETTEATEAAEVEDVEDDAEEDGADADVEASSEEEADEDPAVDSAQDEAETSVDADDADVDEADPDEPEIDESVSDETESDERESAEADDGAEARDDAGEGEVEREASEAGEVDDDEADAEGADDEAQAESTAGDGDTGEGDDEGDATEAAEASEKRRGGLIGWLGRRF